MKFNIERINCFFLTLLIVLATLPITTLAMVLDDSPDSCVESLHSMLKKFDNDGVNTVYSDATIQAWMLVPSLSGDFKKHTAKTLPLMLALYHLQIIENVPGQRLIVPMHNPPVIRSVVYGRVVNQSSRQPIDQARVSLATEEHVIRTNQEGCFVMPTSHHGPLTVHFSAQGYDSHEKVIAVTKQSETAVWQQRVTIQLTASSMDAAIEQVRVNGTRHHLFHSRLESSHELTREDIAAIPRSGEGVSAVIEHLPGVLSETASARVFVRGGAANEVSLLFDGVELIDPYFLREINDGFFSAIDSQIIGSVEVLTGGYGAKYGNALSGIIDVQSATVDDVDQPTKMGMSVLNGSVFSRKAGRWGENNLDYLGFVRQGNFVGNMGNLYSYDNDEPFYRETFGKIQLFEGDTHSLTASTLLGRDRGLFQDQTSAPTGKRYDVRSDSLYAWTQLDSQWNENLHTRTTVSIADLHSERRIGFLTASPEQTIIDDTADVAYLGLQTELAYRLNKNHFVQTGFRVRDLMASYRYRPNGIFKRLTQGLPEQKVRNTPIALDPKGKDYYAWLCWRTAYTKRWTLEGGLRWDKETYSNTRIASKLSPRLNALWQINDSSHLQLGVGRYYQFQRINELQVDEGLLDFMPAQSANHFVLGYHWQPSKQLNVRVDAYRKDYKQLNARYENVNQTLMLLGPELSVTRAQITPERARAQGLEISVKRAFTPSLLGWFNYDLAESYDQIEGVAVPRLWDQSHILMAGLHWSWRQWNLTLAGRYLSGRPVTALKHFSNNGQAGEWSFGEHNQLRRYANHYLDFTISRQWDFLNSLPLRIYLERTNVFRSKGEVHTDMGIEFSF